MIHRQKIPLEAIRSLGVRSLLVYCGNAMHCHHQASINADRWPDQLRLSDLEPRFVCTKCGYVGAEVRPDW